jgi:hypothetical protein
VYSAHRYGLLRAIAVVFKFLAWLGLAVGLLTAVASLFLIAGAEQPGLNLPQLLRITGVLGGPLLGVIWFVQWYAFGSILSLLIDIEENTRLLAAPPME